MRSTFVMLAVATILAAGCSNGTTTSPSSTETTTTTAESPTTTDTFSGTLDIGGSLTFLFDVGSSGTVNAYVSDIRGPKVPSTVQVRLGIGTLDDSGGCTLSTSLLVKAGAANIVSATEQPGTYCASITDVGNLAGPAAFNLAVAHP